MPIFEERDFGEKLGQMLTFDLSVQGQICKFWKNAITGLFTWSSCFTVLFLSKSDLPDPNDKPKRDFGAKLGQILTFELSVQGQICKFWKTPLRACSQGQVASLCRFLSTSDLPDPNDKPKRDFEAKLGQIETFALSAWGQFWEISKTPLRAYF